MHELENLPSGLLSVVLVMVAVIVLAIMIVYCLFLKNLQDTFLAVRSHNRQMPPAQVWLLLISFLNVFTVIPGIMIASGRYDAGAEQNMSTLTIVNGLQKVISLSALIWQYRIVQKLSDSIAREYASRNLPVEAKPTYQIGMIYCICMLAGVILGFMPALRLLASVVSIGSLVLWIMYWIKTAEYKKAMKALPSHPDDESALFSNLY